MLIYPTLKMAPIQGMMGMGGGATGNLVGGSSLLEYIQTFNYTGSVQNYTIPAGITEVTAYIFGAGGGSEGDGVSRGGAGGFTVGKINTTNGGTLKVVVGGAGGPGSQSNGCGGGMSGVFTSSYAQGSASDDQNAAILIAGAGGGGADATDGGNGNAKGGAGGGLTGQKGYVGTGGGDSGGNGGTQSAGGVYPGNGGAGGSCTASSCSGERLRGGTGCGGAEGSAGVGWPNLVYGGTWGSSAGGNGCNAAGGGGGYYGGAGGGGVPNGGCGGGGSSFIGGHSNYAVSAATAYQGNYDVPHSNATSSAYYSSGISKGGIYAVDNGGNGNHIGGHGKIVFVYYA